MRFCLLTIYVLVLVAVIQGSPQRPFGQGLRRGPPPHGNSPRGSSPLARGPPMKPRCREENLYFFRPSSSSVDSNSECEAEFNADNDTNGNFFENEEFLGNVS